METDRRKENVEHPKIENELVNLDADRVKRVDWKAVPTIEAIEKEIDTLKSRMRHLQAQYEQAIEDCKPHFLVYGQAALKLNEEMKASDVEDVPKPN